MQESETHEDERTLLEQLRHELMAPERKRIGELEATLQDLERLTDQVSRVLPKAVKASCQQGAQLAWALRPTLEDSIRETVRTRREELAEAIAPIIGPSIARAVRTAIAEMLERINQALATRLSVQSVRWRIEAARTGRPFAEVVFLRTLVYQVEQVLLVDRESGLLLCHAAGPGVLPQEPSMVSALLTAINAFSREALHVKEGLERIAVGDLSVWLETGPKMMLAAVVRGSAPVELTAVLQRSLEKIDLELAGALGTCHGEMAAFEPARPLLEECLKREHRVARRERGKWIGIGLVAMVAAAALLVTALRFQSEGRFSKEIAALGAEPGLVIVSAERGLRHDRIEGLRDRLARSPEEALRARRLDPRRVELRFGAFQSFDPVSVARRVREMLQPPPGVDLHVQGGKIVLRGRARAAWIERARTLLVAFDPSLQLSAEGLFTAESEEEARAAGDRLAARSLVFPVGRAEVPRDPALWRPIEESVRELLAAAERAGLRATIEIEGDADLLGPSDLNRQLAADRAENTRQALIARGLPGGQLQASGGASNFRREVRFRGVLQAPSRGAR